eukprot:5929571-Pleurochrysis_carterae.AAC.1
MRRVVGSKCGVRSASSTCTRSGSLKCTFSWLKLMPVSFGRKYRRGKYKRSNLFKWQVHSATRRVNNMIEPLWTG